MSVPDMRLKFGMDRAKTTVNTCIIIVEIEIDGDPAVLGALADCVREALALGPAQIEPPPKMGAGLKSKFIKAMGKQVGEFILILDIDRAFCAEELTMPRTSPENLAAASWHERLSIL
ncbi:MAG: chemotaxis protein CheW [Syntrophobacteraceae bacterium]